MQNNSPSIPDIKAWNIYSLFIEHESFKVPNYQRQYAWGSEQTEDLFTDFLTFHNELEMRGSESYIIGQAIFAPNGDSDKSSYKMAIVDGQQRITTIYLLVIALKRWLGFHGISGIGGSDSDATYRALNALLMHSDPLTGIENKRLEVAIGGNPLLAKLLNEARLPDFSAGSDTQQNLMENFQLLEEKIKGNFQTGEELASFARTVIHKVWIITTKLDSESQALEIFEKINSRGLPLNSAELLKALLFKNASDQDFKEISENWNVAAESMFKVRPSRAASMQFLMKSLLGIKQGRGTSNKQVFREWKEQLDNSVEPKSFAKNLAGQAKHVAAIATGSRNAKNAELYACRRFSTVQHIPLVLAAHGTSSNSEIQSHLLQIIDSRFLLSILSGELPQDLERLIWPWARNLSDLNPNSTTEEVLEASKIAYENVDLMFEKAKLAFKNLDYNKPSHAKQIKFVLACASLAAERMNGEAENIDLDNFFAPRQYDLDHIFPRALTLAAGFDASQGTDWVHQPGNIALLYASDNRSQGAAMPTEKVLNFASSKLLLTSTLSQDDHIAGLNDRKARALASLRQKGFSPIGTGWSAHDAEKRADAYWALFEDWARTRLLLK
jgi:hypothetical protein